VAHASAPERFRRSENLTMSAGNATESLSSVMYAGERAGDAPGGGGQGQGRTADLPLFREQRSRRSQHAHTPGVRSACDISALSRSTWEASPHHLVRPAPTGRQRPRCHGVYCMQIAVGRCGGCVTEAQHQGGASRRRWPGVSAGLCLGRPARRTPGHTLSRVADQPG